MGVIDDYVCTSAAAKQLQPTGRRPGGTERAALAPHALVCEQRQTRRTNEGNPSETVPCHLARKDDT